MKVDQNTYTVSGHRFKIDELLTIKPDQECVLEGDEVPKGTENKFRSDALLKELARVSEAEFDGVRNRRELNSECNVESVLIVYLLRVERTGRLMALGATRTTLRCLAVLAFFFFCCCCFVFFAVAAVLVRAYGLLSSCSGA